MLQGKPNGIVFLVDSPMVSKHAVISDTVVQYVTAILEEHGETRDFCFTTICDEALPKTKRVIPLGTLREWREDILLELKTLNPQVVIACGSNAIKLFDTKEKAAERSHGKKTWIEELNCYVIFTFNLNRMLFADPCCRDIVNDLRTICRYKNAKHEDVVLPPYIVVDSAESADLFLKQAAYFLDSKNAFDFSILDIETTGLHILKDKTRSTGISFNIDDNWIIQDHFLNNSEWFREELSHLLSNRDFHWVGQNANQFDRIMLNQEYGFDLQVSDDTMLMHYMLDERSQGHGLKILARVYCDSPVYAEIDWKDQKIFTEEYIREVMYPYQVWDLYYTRLVYLELKQEIEKEAPHLLSVQRDILLKGTRVLGEMKQKGILIDREYLTQLEVDYGEIIEKEYKELLETAKEIGIDEFNPASTQQVLNMFESLGYNMMSLKKKKSVSKAVVKEQVIENPIEASHKEMAEKLLDLRGSRKMKSTYLKSILNKIDEDKMLRGSYSVMGTQTGRLSAREPNLTNLPARAGGLIKQAFITEPGHTIVNIDYSQIELRVAGWLSGDKYLLETYNNNYDIHRSVAASMYLVEYEQVTDKQRTSAKPVSFGK